MLGLKDRMHIFTWLSLSCKQCLDHKRLRQHIKKVLQHPPLGTLTCTGIQHCSHPGRFVTGLGVPGASMLMVGSWLWLLTASQLDPHCACASCAASSEGAELSLGGDPGRSGSGYLSKPSTHSPTTPPPPKKKNCLKVEEASLWGVKFHFKASLTGSEVPTAPLKSDLQWIV